MGQEQSYAHASTTHYKDYKTTLEYRHSSADYKSKNFEQYKSHRSGDSFKSDKSTESSGYRSGNSTYDYSTDDYYRLSLYKNEHYKDVSKELYKPVKITKDKRYKLSLHELDKGEAIKNARLKSFLDESEKAKLNKIAVKKSCIRNYTPKILSEEDRNKKLENWL